MTSLVLKTPAKINLCLNVLNKRPDGYHNIQTIFERINIFDTLSISSKKQDRIKIICGNPDVPLDERNLAYQAAAILRSRFGIKDGLDIKIKKRIPVAAGLAGASSNAACVLEGINKLFHLKLNRKQLMQYGARIGSDVPFFLSGSSFAWATGRGIKIKPLNIKKVFWYVVAVPRLRVLTREIYRDFAKISKSLTKKRIFAKIWHSALQKKDTSWLGSNCFNSLENVVLRRFSQVSKLKNQIKSLGLEMVLMSGSGPSVFGMTKSRKEADSLRRRLQSKQQCQIFVARTC